MPKTYHYWESQFIYEATKEQELPGWVKGTGNLVQIIQKNVLREDLNNGG